MKISTKGRYGIRALIDLAVNSTNGHMSLVNIANRNQISCTIWSMCFPA